MRGRSRDLAIIIALIGIALVGVFSISRTACPAGLILSQNSLPNLAGYLAACQQETWKMGKQRYTTEEIIHKLREADVLIGQGQPVAQATKRSG